MRTIGFINWKGGVGKTCIAINTAYALAESWGARVLFIDMDKQANASYWFGKDDTKGTLGNILVKGTFVFLFQAEILMTNYFVNFARFEIILVRKRISNNSVFKILNRAI